MNSRYLNWCRINGNSPDQQKERDTENYKGGIMTGFVIWIQENVSLFLKNNPEYNCCGSLSSEGHTKFNEYLDNLEVIKK